MNNFDKQIRMEIFILFFCSVIMIWAFYLAFIYHKDAEQRCKDAGGVSVNMACINPTAIIEVDR